MNGLIISIDIEASKKAKQADKKANNILKRERVEGTLEELQARKSKRNCIIVRGEDGVVRYSYIGPADQEVLWGTNLAPLEKVLEIQMMKRLQAVNV